VVAAAWNAFPTELSDITEAPVSLKNDCHSYRKVLYQEPSGEHKGSEKMKNLGSTVTDRGSEASHTLAPPPGFLLRNEN
jgi:hypothetical protein